MQAGIERARAVIACVDSDAENIFIALSARELRSDILIIARASAEDSEQKLIRAGADRVISPYKTTGSEMARIALHPQVGGAVEVADYRIEEIEVPASCAGVGKTIAEVRGQSVIVALRRATDARAPAGAAGGDRGGRHADRARHRAVARATRERVPADASVRAHERPASRPTPSRRCARSARGARRCAATAPASRAAPTLERPKRAGQGDYATNAAMLLAPVLGAPPREIAERLGSELADALGDGARRLRGRRARLPEPGAVRRLAPRRAALRCSTPATRSAPAAPRAPERILLEFVSANPTGPLVAASGRHAAYGDSLGADPRSTTATRSPASTTSTTPARQIRRARRVGAGACARRRSRPRTATRATTSPTWRRRSRAPATSRRRRRGRRPRAVAMLLERDQGDADPLRRAVRHASSASARCTRARRARSTARSTQLRGGGHVYEHDGAVWLRTTTFGDDKDRVLRALRRRADLLRRRRRLHAEQARARLRAPAAAASAPTTTATSRG